MTDKDKSCKGELPGKTVKEVLVAGGCTIDEEFLDEKLPADDLTDYADFLSGGSSAQAANHLTTC